MNEIDYSWVAGFWDGEGNISTIIRGSFGRPRSVMQVSQVNREPLDRVQRILDCGSVLGPYKQINKNAQDYYVWRCEAGPILYELKNKIYEYLCSDKRKQLDYAIFCKEDWERNGKCALGHRLTKDKIDRWRCVECQSVQGKKNADARWAKVKVMGE